MEVAVAGDCFVKHAYVESADYSNHHLAGAMPTVEQADADYSLWSHRLRHKRFALLGGEPRQTPQLPPPLLTRFSTSPELL